METLKANVLGKSQGQEGTIFIFPVLKILLVILTCYCGLIRRIASVNSPFDDKLVVLKMNSYQNNHERKKP